MENRETARKILHICAGWEHWNGASNIARMIMEEQRREGHEVTGKTWAGMGELRRADEVWIHCGWKPCLWWAALWGRHKRWMPEGCYDPVRLRYHGWKKRLAGPVERWGLRRCEKVVATCEAEREWCRRYIGKGCPEVAVTDIKRFFKLQGALQEWNTFSDAQLMSSLTRRLSAPSGTSLRSWLPSEAELLRRISDCLVSARDTDFRGLHSSTISHKKCSIPSAPEEAGGGRENAREVRVLYMGRRHELKGVEYLEEAVKGLEGVELRIVSGVTGEEKEKVWEWCDVLALPTLSDNFGLVVAEALERGKQAIVTDGAPVWGEEAIDRFTDLPIDRLGYGRGEAIDRFTDLPIYRLEYGRGEAIDRLGYGGRLMYVRGYREGTKERRVELLREAILKCMRKANDGRDQTP